MNELDKAINGIIGQLQGSALKDATAAAGEVILKEVQSKAKGSIRNNVTIKTFPRKGGVRSTIQIDESVKGGENHHAVFLEYGTSHMPAQPFMRPAYDAAASRAVEVFASTLTASLEK